MLSMTLKYTYLKVTCKQSGSKYEIILYNTILILIPNDNSRDYQLDFF